MTTETSTAVLDQLNAYAGDNIWNDVIYRLDYDEAATDAAYEDAGRNSYYSDIAVIGGVSYHYREQIAQWVVA